jgi:hypothetical protein
MVDILYMLAETKNLGAFGTELGFREAVLAYILVVAEHGALFRQEWADMHAEGGIVEQRGSKVSS